MRVIIRSRGARRRAHARRLIRYQPQKALQLARNPRLLFDLIS